MRFSPDFAFSANTLDWDECFRRILKAKEKAESNYKIAIGLIAITSRQLGASSCRKTVNWAVKWNDYICGVDLADVENIYPPEEFKQSIEIAKRDGLKVTVHSG